MERKMESVLKSTVHPLRFNIIVLGKTGNGKSASGNTILRKKSFKSVTQEVQMDSVTVDGVTLNVYDTPGTSNKISIQQCQSLFELDESARTVILLVIKAGKSACEEQCVQQIRDSIPECLVPNTWILFTKGDELERVNLTIEQFIEDSEEVKKLLKRFQYRYHVFNNFSQSPDQVTELINKIKQAPEIIPPEMGYPQTTPPYPEKDSLHRRIVLVGKTGVGKSATGNTILVENRFRSEFSSSSITSKCEVHQAVVSGMNVSVIDTPGLFDTKINHEKLGMEIGRSIYLSSPGPHAFLYVQSVNIRFTEQEENVFQKLELIFGREMKKYTMILFTYGDLLKGRSVETVIQGNSSLCKLVNECGGGYHVINNEQLKNRQQVTELLEKIDRMVKRNGGTCYSNQMYEEAARIRKVEQERRTSEEDRKKEEKETLRCFVGDVEEGGNREIQKREREEGRGKGKRERLDREEEKKCSVREEIERLNRAEEERRRENAERLKREEERRREKTEPFRREEERKRGLREEEERLKRENEESRRVKEELDRFSREEEERRRVKKETERLDREEEKRRIEWEETERFSREEERKSVGEELERLMREKKMRTMVRQEKERQEKGIMETQEREEGGQGEKSFRSEEENGFKQFYKSNESFFHTAGHTAVGGGFIPGLVIGALVDVTVLGLGAALPIGLGIGALIGVGILTYKTHY